MCRLYCLLHIPGPDDLSAADVGGRGGAVGATCGEVHRTLGVLVWHVALVYRYMYCTLCVVYVDGIVAC